MGEGTICTDCGTSLPHNPRRKGSRCKPCNARAVARAPEHRAAVGRAMERRWKDPVQRRSLITSIKASCNKPEVVELRREIGRVQNNVLRFAPPMPSGHPARVRGGKTRTETMLGWCPPEYRADYIALNQNGRFPAAEARAIIEAQISAHIRMAQSGKLPPAEFMAVRQAARYLAERRA